MKEQEKSNLCVWCEFPLESCVWRENETSKRVLLGWVPFACPLPQFSGSDTVFFNARKSLEEENLPAVTILKKSPVDLHLHAVVASKAEAVGHSTKTLQESPVLTNHPLCRHPNSTRCQEKMGCRECQHKEHSSLFFTRPW